MINKYLASKREQSRNLKRATMDIELKRYCEDNPRHRWRKES